MTITEALLGFAMMVALLTVIPGIDTTLVLRSSLTRTRGYAWATALGISTGTVVWGVAAAAGATALLAASSLAYQVVSLAGALYLAGLGVSFILTSFRTPPASEAEARLPEPTGGAWRAWTIGLTTNLLNPKVGVFYLATIPHFIPPGTSPLLMGALLALTHAVLNLLWSGAIILAGSAIGRRMRTPGVLRWLDRVTGGVLLAFGVRMAFDSRA
ncbi:MAG: LysE family translocator [Propioniciclava sp.]|uniref:LysE family translocator n=1 Tax=Propioniciclava sp. TaxID=2038686 RepID=UPI0039E7021D